MVKLSDLLARSKPLTIPIEDHCLTVHYRVYQVTDQLILTRGGQASERGTLVEALVALVAAWDLVDDAGQPWPLTVEGVAQVPVDLRALIYSAIMDDVYPNPPPASPS